MTTVARSKGPDSSEGPDPTFGRVIKSRRRALDMTQQDLASRVGYSVITIRKVESNERRPSRQLAERLAQCLHIDPDQRHAFVVLARLDKALLAENGLTPRDLALSELAPALAPTNLATPLTRLIGREVEGGIVRDTVLESGARLVTLVGPPGIGKSRLSVEVASQLRQLFPDGVFVVELAALGDPALVASSIATAIGVRESSAQPLAATLIDHLRGRRLLLLLDNCEHLLAAAPLVAELLGACPGLRVLATSRAPLHVRGERLVPVPPLALPEPHRCRSAVEVARYAAVQLFVERARAVAPDFALTDQNACDVAAICAELDGIPLAIELVAARITLLTPEAILTRLNHRLALLTDGPRDLPERQQTLRRAIDWSYDLLDPGEQLLFARLAVFSGGFSLVAAEDVVDVDGHLPVAVLDGMIALADRHLLRLEERLGAGRYAVFFETIREYALERLVERGEEADLRARHAAYYLSLAENAGRELAGAEQEAWLNRVEAEHHNLRAVLEWHLQRGAADAALRLVAALWKFWHIRSYQTEAERWIAQVLELPGERDPAALAYVLYGAGWIAVDRGDYPSARSHFAQSLTLMRSLREPRGIAESLHGVGVMLLMAGDNANAITLFDESLTLFRELDDAEGIAWSLDHLGRGAMRQQDYHGAEALFRESRSIFLRLGHAWGQAITLDHLGLADLLQGNLDRAAERFGTALALFRELANSWGMATCLDQLGYVARAAGDSRTAGVYFRQSLAINQAEADRDGIVRSLAGLASLAVAGRQLDRAGCLFGALESAADRMSVAMEPFVRSQYQSDLAVVRMHLGRDVVAAAWHRGRVMSLAEVATYGATGD